MINISKIDEYWWAIMRDDYPGKDKRTQIRPEIFKSPEILGIISCAVGGA